MSHKIINLYFSPTHSSKKIGELIGARLAEKMDYVYTPISFTLPDDREQTHSFAKDDALIFAFPVYSGRIPAVVTEALKEKIKGHETRAIPVAVYGNRAFDDALLEAADLLTSLNFRVIAGISDIAQHTFAPEIAPGRPDDADKKALQAFADKIAARIQSGKIERPKIPGNSPYLTPKALPNIAPSTNDACNYCGICARDCPLGIIDSTDEHIVGLGCILCTACIKFCPQKAKSLPQEFLATVQAMLAKSASVRKEPELFL